ncbi:hypothetical protein COUCH_36545 [Couchioplanes caeruleus]|uniref:hypothetical protein n=1 Tax=Couchioplanes caeruleus TaxID=56438 RepID=UPI0020BE2F7C|nr:hypothetical protein [Couchioplanes caeruleus]UQU64406.1 hypothetical protein COUCH_36545 [Couchioplanes caeruleus]
MFDSQYDPLYVAARRVLLDACDALDAHREALVLVGAQAVYLRAGDADLEGVAPFTTDADLSIDPMLLAADPAIVRAMTDAGFALKVKAGGNGVEPGPGYGVPRCAARRLSSRSTSWSRRASRPDPGAMPSCPITGRTPRVSRLVSRPVCWTTTG